MIGCRRPFHLLRLLLELLFFDFFDDFFFSSSESEELLLLLDESDDSEPLSSLLLLSSSFLVLFLDPPPLPDTGDFLERLAETDGVTDLSLLWGAGRLEPPFSSVLTTAFSGESFSVFTLGSSGIGSAGLLDLFLLSPLSLSSILSFLGDTSDLLVSPFLVTSELLVSSWVSSGLATTTLLFNPSPLSLASPPSPPSPSSSVFSMSLMLGLSILALILRRSASKASLPSVISASMASQVSSANFVVTRLCSLGKKKSGAATLPPPPFFELAVVLVRMNP